MSQEGTLHLMDQGVRGGRLTLAAKVLLAAFALATEPDFDLEDLVVTAWELFPLSFGLSGYDRKYPDSNKVSAILSGSTGLVKRGWLRRTGRKLYQLTPDGSQLASRLIEDWPLKSKSDREEVDA